MERSTGSSGSYGGSYGGYGGAGRNYGGGYGTGSGRRDLARRGDYGLSYSGGSSPFGMIRRMMDEMDRAFDDFFLGGGGRRGGGQGQTLQWMPQVEMREKDGRLVVCADLPGMRKEDVHVEVQNDQLILQGERRQESEQQGYSERRYGSFYRVIPLPEGIDPAQAKASFQNGVLEISLPAPRESQGHRIEIQEGGASSGQGAGSSTGAGSPASSGVSTGAGATGSSRGGGTSGGQTSGQTSEKPSNAEREHEIPVGAGKL